MATTKKTAKKKAKKKTKRARSRSAGAAKAGSRQKKATRKRSAQSERSRRTGKKVARSKRRSPKKRPSDNSLNRIHCTLAPAGDTAMLLPTSAIAEITDYVPPTPIDEAPVWLLGQVEWEDWQVPVISYGAMLKEGQPETATAGSRIMVVKSLSNTARVPFIGILLSQIPKLANVSESELELTGEDDLHLAAHARVSVEGRNAVIPDLDNLAQLVGHAAYGEVERGSQEVGQA